MSNIDPIKIIRQLLFGKTSVTVQEVETAVDTFMKMNLPISESRQMLIRKVEELFTIRQDEFRSIEKADENLPWLNEKRSKIDFENGFWGSYRQYLEEEKNFAPDVVNKLDRLTDSILDNFFDPTEKIKVNKKGLVVGQVQSGKTANYTGLICKAADAGFGLIIVMAGIHNNLRSQTQIRIDESFLGFDTQHTRALNQKSIKIGVGRPGFGKLNVAHSLTSSQEKGDFTQGAANALGLNFDTPDPIIAVIKKNPNVLKRIHQWLSAQADEDTELGRVIRNKALLLIDDEADNASINISNDPAKQSSINGWITQILNLFGKNAYVGYTATPFANIFIPLDDQNLFPRNFIKNIPAPSNYIGPEKVFGFSPLTDDESSDTVLPIVNRISDYEAFIPDRHKKNDQLPSSLPVSLKNAIRCFIITCAVRRLRGQTTVHNSMLVHVSRFMRWQDHFAELITNQFIYYRRGIDQNDSEILNELKATFEQDEIGYKSYVSVSHQIIDSNLRDLDSQIQVHQWCDVLQHLNDAASRIVVKSIHGGSGEALDYFDHKNGLSVIAVGGNKLSRGLTLEGLSVSYYLRASRMYDTLMQMGRWFGYRGGYVDLCRLFTSEELNQWYCQITDASNELRQEFEYMSEDAKSTPEKYALKVRTFPGTLLVTALNKLKNVVYFDLSYSGRLVQTTILLPRKLEAERNLNVLKTFIGKLDAPRFDKNAFFVKDVCSRILVDEFISNFEFHSDLKTINVPLLKKYIADCNSKNELSHWTVAIFSSQDKDAVKFSLDTNYTTYDIGLTKRSKEAHTYPTKDNLFLVNNSQIISPRHEFIDIERLPENPTGRKIRSIRDPRRGLLMIYLLEPQFIDLDHNVPLVAFALSFPESPSDVKVRYAAHNQLIDYLDWEETDEDYNYDED
ncbi:Z1 domain-containing protein [Dyadobacter jejuensis]|uniref:Z1 domain-containing protein n=1 Tax=Dyadobacter jejuensis TaxID=1082580 RepID=A0A316AI63_9BACT|nr:Z1 domain-containing protein [Dyadobacter jejuensis]PWJ57383.1 Z1 domain-containing protein [Dyadobacter jejuensis]